MAFISRRTTKDGEEKYRVGYRKDGKQHFTPTIDTPEGAVEMKRLVESIGPDAALAILRARTKGSTSGQTRTVQQTLDAYLDSLASHATPGTVDDYRRMVARTWGPRLGPLPVTALTRDHVIEWVAWQRTQETHRSAQARARAQRHNDNCKPGHEIDVPAPRMYAVKSIRNAHTVLSQMLSWEAERNQDVSNVARGVQFPDDEVENEQEIFTRDEFMALYEAMDDHYKPFVLFLCATGCRINEAAAVQVRDLNLDPHSPAVSIRRAMKKGAGTSRYLGSPKSRRSRRTIMLDPATAEALRPIVDGRHAEDWVFTTRQGRQINDNNFRGRQWAKALRDAGITKRLTPHSLRHTHASWLLMAGTPAQVVQHRLGHESLDTTSKTYAHLLIDAQAPAVAVMGSHLPRARGQIEG